MINVLLLLALPASGKSEIRRYLDHIGPQVGRRDFHLGPTVQLDDYPYVHLMRRISQELRALQVDPIFFHSDAESMIDPRDWGTLIELVNGDYADLSSPPSYPTGPATDWLLDRIERARQSVGIAPALADLPASIRSHLVTALEPESRALLDEKLAAIPPSPAGRTTVIEFARGGPQGADLPLPEPLGYRYSLSRLSPEILDRARILYVWVTPEESRRKNRERAQPGLEGDASILHHGVPETVMRNDYGTDDLRWLLNESGNAGFINVERDGTSFRVPTAVFDNRSDLTSFLRAEPEQWDPADLARLHDALSAALEPLDS